MMFGLSSFNLINEFEQVSNESNTEQVSNESNAKQFTSGSITTLFKENVHIK